MLTTKDIGDSGKGVPKRFPVAESEFAKPVSFFHC